MPPPLPDITKNYLAALGGAVGPAALAKFPPLFPALPNDASSAADILTHLSSPNLYRALHRKYQQQQQQHLGAKFPDGPDSPVLKQMPFLKNVADFSALYPRPPVAAGGGADSGDADSDGIAERSPPPPGIAGLSVPLPPPPAHQSVPVAASPLLGRDDENGGMSDGGGGNGSSPMDSDFNTPPPPPSGPASESGNDESKDGKGRSGGKYASGRGSRLERMIAAEYKIMSEYVPGDTTPVDLPMMTPELMKSRRTHSLQLAIGEILNNRASVQSAATKYHIPRETLRRHYQRYLKAMGIKKAPATNGAAPGGGSGGGGGGPSAASSPGNPVNRSAVATNNNATSKPPPGVLEAAAAAANAMAAAAAAQQSAAAAGGVGAPGENGFSSLMEIGQAYGIWNPDVDGSDLAAKLRQAREKHEAAMRAATAIDAKGEGGNKDLVIDEDEDIELEDDEDEEVNPGSPEVARPEGEAAEEGGAQEREGNSVKASDKNDNNKESSTGGEGGEGGKGSQERPTPMETTA